jgi:type I restriction enzyme, R subunit
MIRDTLEVYEINENLLERLANDDTPDTVKVFNLLKSIEDMVGANLKHAPYLLFIGERAQAIVQSYQDRQQATQETLHALEKIIDEINQAERERAEKALRPAAFAVYWTLRGEGLSDPETMAREIEKTLDKYPYWRVSNQQERDVRRELYRVLISTMAKRMDGHGSVRETNQLPGLVEKLLKVAGRAEG